MLNKANLNKFKPSLQIYLTQIYYDNESGDLTLNQVVSEVEKAILSMLNTADHIFVTSLLHKIEKHVQLEDFIYKLGSSFNQPNGKFSNEEKTLINTILKQIVKINAEIKSKDQEVPQSIDIDAYIS